MNWVEIKIKPLSVNRVWKGKKYKTEIYENYEEALGYLLPKGIGIFKDSKLKIDLIFGVSSKGSDIDNPVKPFLDILQKVYLFNDNHIYEMNLKKVITKKKSEFIRFKIEKLDE